MVVSGQEVAELAAFRELPAGTLLFHRDWGEGRPVVFVSSWALTSEMWAYQVAQLSDGHRCIAFDRRGHGRSDPASRGYVDKVMRDHWTQQDVERELRKSAEYRNKGL